MYSIPNSPISSSASLAALARAVLFLALAAQLAQCGPAASCASTAPSASDACCTIAQGGTFSGLLFANKVTNVDQRAISCSITPCVLCAESNPSDTASAAAKQSDLDSVMQFFLQNRCFGGQIADAPGDNVRSLDFPAYYNRQICVAKCSAASYNFTAAGIPGSSATCQQAGSGSSGDGGLGLPLIAGAAGGGAALCALAIGVAVWLKKRQNESKQGFGQSASQPAAWHTNPVSANYHASAGAQMYQVPSASPYAARV